jgi:ATP synthase F1 delta subunit
LDELGMVASLMEKSGEFKRMLVNPGFTVEEREKALKVIAEKVRLSEKVTAFLVHAAEAKVITALPAIIKMATALYLEKKRRAKAVVMSPVEIGKSYEERLKASLAKLLDRDVDLEFVLDKSLLGGVMVKVGSTMYDSSVKGQLRLLKDELIKG